MTAERDQIVQDLLLQAGWADARVVPLAGDASNRRYLRARLGDKTAVIMDAPPEKGEDVRPFVEIAKHLSRVGLSAPQIIGSNPQAGVLLLEDLGDDLFARWIRKHPGDEVALYSAAVDVLIELHKVQPPSNIRSYSEEMPGLSALASYWYAGHKDMSPIGDAIAAALRNLPAQTEVLILRDYHAENLIWLPSRTSPANVGLLDFQDARLGSRAYDVASLLRDARRDVDPKLEHVLLSRYTRAFELNLKDFELEFATMSAQRNLRILGVFARLSLHFGKPGYVDLIPRVWRNLEADLSHPGLADLQRVVIEYLNPPSDDHLKDLKARCSTLPFQPLV